MLTTPQDKVVFLTPAEAMGLRKDGFLVRLVRAVLG